MKLFGKNRQASKTNTPKPRYLRFESLEERRMLSGTPGLIGLEPQETEFDPKSTDLVHQEKNDLIWQTASHFAQIMQSCEMELPCHLQLNDWQAKVMICFGPAYPITNGIIHRIAMETDFDFDILLQKKDAIFIFRGNVCFPESNFSSENNFQTNGGINNPIEDIFRTETSVSEKTDPVTGAVTLNIPYDNKDLEYHILIESTATNEIIDCTGTISNNVLTFSIPEMEASTDAPVAYAVYATARVGGDSEDPGKNDTPNTQSAPSDVQMISANGGLAGFTWKPVLGLSMDKYSVFICKASSATKGVSSNEGSSESYSSISSELGEGEDERNFLYFMGLEPGETYYFFIRAQDGEDSWIDSEIYGFQTQQPNVN